MNKTLGENKIPCNDKEINFFKGFFALKMYAGLMGIKRMQEAWSKNEPLKAYTELQKVITFKLYNRIRKHFRVTIQMNLRREMTLATIRCKMSTGRYHT